MGLPSCEGAFHLERHPGAAAANTRWRAIQTTHHIAARRQRGFRVNTRGFGQGAPQLHHRTGHGAALAEARHRPVTAQNQQGWLGHLGQIQQGWLGHLGRIQPRAHGGKVANQRRVCRVVGAAGKYKSTSDPPLDCPGRSLRLESCAHRSSPEMGGRLGRRMSCPWALAPR